MEQNPQQQYHKWRCKVALGYVIFFCLCANPLELYKYQFHSLPALVWLLGHFISRITLAFIPYLLVNDMDICKYAFILLGWFLYGSGCFIMSIYHTIYPIDDHILSKFIWLLIMLVYVVDTVIFIHHFWSVRETLRPEGLRMRPADGGPIAPIPTIPKRKKTKKRRQMKTHRYYTECIICSEKFMEDDMVKDLPCKHIFHPECIEKWFEKSKSCPTCKVKI